MLCSSNEAVCIHARRWVIQDVPTSDQPMCQVCYVYLLPTAFLLTSDRLHPLQAVPGNNLTKRQSWCDGSDRIKVTKDCHRLVIRHFEDSGHWL